MNAPAVRRMKVPEFLAWAATQDRPHVELVHGQVVAMAPERLEHSRAKLRAATALDAAIRRAGIDCEAFVDGPGIAIDDDTCYEPDALVSCGERGADDAMIAPNPVIVAEVLSPSTRDIDKTVKLADYFRVPGLSHYLVIDLGRRHVVHYRRDREGVVTVAIAQDGDIALNPPGISVAVASLFD
jgi:Uma2 family endonuclease